MKAYDLLVVGGGVQGLWLARRAIAAGLSVALVEARRAGAGASGGLLGALMPHMPDTWNEKKQFQFDALVEIESLVEELSAETGIETGYRRCGRVMPIRTTGFHGQFPRRLEGSRVHWQAAGASFELSLEAPDAMAGWLDPEEAPLGIFHDPLAARIEPKRYLAALVASLEGRCDIFEGWAFQGFDQTTGRAVCDRGGTRETLVAATTVLAAGYETFALIEQVTGLKLGAGIKGQAALLAADLPDIRPIIYDDGLYIVAHTRDRCAIGSTTEQTWQDVTASDAKIEARIEQARRLCPPLRTADVIATWSGVRPKCAARDPIAGRLALKQPIWIATGGFKITFGIAHRIAARVVEAIIAGRHPVGLPAGFAPEAHMSAQVASPTEGTE